MSKLMNMKLNYFAIQVASTQTIAARTSRHYTTDNYQVYGVSTPAKK